MFPFASLRVTLLLALSIVASSIEVRNSPVTLPIARRLNLNGGAVNLLQHGQARAAALKNHTSNLSRRAGSSPAINEVFNYIVQVNIGSPATTYDLIVDLGSSNTWVGAGTRYVETSTSFNTGEPVALSYGAGAASFSGTEYTDTVSLGTGLTITGQSIGVASDSTGVAADGILGIGPLILTEGTLTDDPSTTIPTVTMNLYTQGVISEEVVSISFEPTNQEVNDGELTFGSTDSTVCNCGIAYVPLTTTSPASDFWGIDQSITYGSQLIASGISGVVDTGTTLILLATDVYNVYKSATGATVDDNTGLLRITPTQYDALESLYFGIGDEVYELIPNGQIWPRNLNFCIGGTSDSIYLVVGDLGTPSGQGLDFINGFTFLERFYSVFDTTNSRVGFATTEYTFVTAN